MVTRTNDLARERRLVQALIDNDPRAWRELRRRHDRLVLSCITRITSRFSAVSADDVREIYSRWQIALLANDRAKLRAFDPSRGARFSSYLGMLATHCAYDWLRIARREWEHADLSEARHLPTEAPDPFECAAQEERARLAARAMADFSERDRAFATLCFGEGMDPHEIAKRLQISVKTVYSKKHKIKAKLESIVANIKDDDVAA
jgi:RNA polymerase sigma-70 factor (ECF subfamily)